MFIYLFFADLGVETKQKQEQERSTNTTANTTQHKLVEPSMSA